MASLKLRDRLRLAARALVGVFDDRSAQLAWGLLSGIYPGAAGTPPTRGTEEFLKAYSTMPWLRAVFSRIAFGVSSTDWKLYVGGRSGGKAQKSNGLARMPYRERKAAIRRKQEEGELREIETHIMLDVLHNANEFHTGLTLRKITQIHIDLVGEAFWLKERNGLGAPTGFWPIPPNWVQMTPTPSRRTFRVGFRGWQGEIPDTEFVWFAEADPWNPYGRGTGTGRSLADELETDEYAAKFMRQKFFNQARPDFLVYPKGENSTIKPEEVIRLQQRWLDEHQGFWRQFKPMFLSREVGIHEFDQENFRDLQMIQLRQHERDTIIQATGMPPELLGILENSNRATIGAADFLFARWVLVPRLEFLRSVLQERLVPEYDERLIVDYVSPVEEDQEFALKVAQAAPWSRKVSEWREWQGLEVAEDGSEDVYMVPFSLTPQTELGGMPPPIDIQPIPQAAPRSRSLLPPAGRGTVIRLSPGGNGRSPEIAQWRASLKADAACFQDAGDAEGEASCVKALADDPDDLPALVRLASRLEPEFRREFLRGVEIARNGINVEALAEALLSGTISTIEAAAQVEELASQAGTLGPILRRGFLQGAGFAHQGLTDAGLTMLFDLINPHAQSWVDRAGARLVTEITEEQRLVIQELVRESISGARDVRRTAQMIRDTVGLHSRQANAVERFRLRLEADGTLTDAVIDRRVARYSEAQLRYRSRLIARTEVIQAESQGQYSLWAEAKVQGLLNPAKTYRRWIVTADDRLDLEICEPMDGDRGLVKLDEAWELPNGVTTMIPFGHPQCRCSAGLEFK